MKSRGLGLGLALCSALTTAASWPTGQPGAPGPAMPERRLTITLDDLPLGGER